MFKNLMVRLVLAVAIGAIGFASFCTHASESSSTVEPEFTAADTAVYQIEGTPGGTGITLQVWGNKHKAGGGMTWLSYGNAEQIWFVGVMDPDGSAPGLYTFNLYRPSAQGLFADNLVIGNPIGVASIVKSDEAHELLMDYRFGPGFQDCSGFSPPAPHCAGTVFLRRLSPVPTP